jgi:hypothetical protein
VKTILRFCHAHPKWASGLGAALALVVVIGAVGDNGRPPHPDAHVANSTGSPAPSRATTDRDSPASPGDGSADPLSSTAAVRSSAAPKPSAVRADGVTASSTATAVLDTLVIKGRAPKTDYSRGQFGAAWTDDNDDPGGHNGCRTRDDILARDLTDVVRADGCKVTSGVLVDPYTGRTITFRYGQGTSSAVQIDHVVALSDAWQKGAQYWDARRRVDLANDPLNLLAVDGPTNQGKGDGDAATWLPPNKAYRCAYVARQVAVKARYGLWMTRAERDAIARVLSACPGQRVPTEAGAPPTVRPHSSAEPAPSAYHSPAAPTTRAAVVQPPATSAKSYANCTALRQDYPHGVGRPGARDHTSGKPDTRFFVSAALYDANTKSDRDKDGIACEA